MRTTCCLHAYAQLDASDVQDISCMSAIFRDLGFKGLAHISFCASTVNRNRVPKSFMNMTISFARRNIYVTVTSGAIKTVLFTWGSHLYTIPVVRSLRYKFLRSHWEGLTDGSRPAQHTPYRECRMTTSFVVFTPATFLATPSAIQLQIMFCLIHALHSTFLDTHHSVICQGVASSCFSSWEADLPSQSLTACYSSSSKSQSCKITELWDNEIVKLHTQICL